MPFRYHGGPLLSQPRAQAVFWGSAWLPKQKLAQQLHTLLTQLLTGPFMIPLAPYGIHAGSTDPPVLLNPVPLPPPGQPLSTHVLGEFLAGRARVGAGGVAPAHPQRFYVVFTPPGLPVMNSVGQTTGVDIQAFHDVNMMPNAAPVPYAVVPVLPLPFGPLIQSVTLTLSHELVDTVTDPLIGSGWLDEAGNELADVGGTIHLGGGVVVRIPPPAVHLV